jgi:hypothetical protein
VKSRAPFPLPTDVSVIFLVSISPAEHCKVLCKSWLRFIRNAVGSLCLSPRRDTRCFLLQNRLNGMWCPPSLFFSEDRRSFQGLKRLGRDGDHSTPSGAKVKNEWSYTYTPRVSFLPRAETTVPCFVSLFYSSFLALFLCGAPFFIFPIVFDFFSFAPLYISFFLLFFYVRRTVRFRVTEITSFWRQKVIV